MFYKRMLSLSQVDGLLVQEGSLTASGGGCMQKYI